MPQIYVEELLRIKRPTRNCPSDNITNSTTERLGNSHLPGGNFPKGLSSPSRRHSRAGQNPRARDSGGRTQQQER